MFFRKRTQTEPWVDDLIKRIIAMERAMATLNDEQEEQADKLQRLRGVVYGRKLHKEPLPEQTEEAPEPRSLPLEDTSRMSREELKRYLTRSGRFTPGKPAQHSE